MKNKGGDGETETFTLSWKNTKGGQSKDKIFVDAIKAWSDDKQWRYEGESLEIKKGEGQTDITMKKFTPE